MERNIILQEESIMNTSTKQPNWWDRIMAAITFAEAGEPETARDILDKRTIKQQRPESRPGKRSEKRPQLRV